MDMYVSMDLHVWRRVRITTSVIVETGFMDGGVNRVQVHMSPVCYIIVVRNTVRYGKKSLLKGLVR